MPLKNRSADQKFFAALEVNQGHNKNLNGFIALEYMMYSTVQEMKSEGVHHE